MLDRIEAEDRPWDMVVIGGGASGVGVAVDAASRGYRVALLEQSDFGKGTSSRSTKLVHGGVRYLQRGNISLVMEALRERGILRRNAPHLVHDLAFVVPNYDWWEAPFYGIGMKVYDLLAGKYNFGKSRLLGKQELLERIPGLSEKGLRGGVLYYDGQFDDARLLISLAMTAADHGAAMVNYARVTGLMHAGNGMIEGVEAVDELSGRSLRLACRCVINATGPFVDAVRKLDDQDAQPMIAPSQGVHLVLDSGFLQSRTAIMVPRTSDKRVMFAIPWHGRVVVGTTDTPINRCELEPEPLDEEIDFILETAAPYLRRSPSRADVLSVFTGIRPLVRSGESTRTASLSRDHVLHISKSGLITLTGGKWTTYRRMAEDCTDHAAMLAELPEAPCVTEDLRIHGYGEIEVDRDDPLAVYGTDARSIRRMASRDRALGEPLVEGSNLTAARVLWSVRNEMAMTVEDVLSRRGRELLLDSRRAVAMAPTVATIMAEELGRDESWRASQIEAFERLARVYQV
ncbi:MAG: glycerol-3-phosphate dehydrogenase/oxidase [Phycisphaeraceae bacterium]|nr:glycerol-3-phosphate dehydrogenase/oxidase [Phycisphaeraceae bacterium]